MTRGAAGRALNGGDRRTLQICRVADSHNQGLGLLVAQSLAGTVVWVSIAGAAQVVEGGYLAILGSTPGINRERP